MKNLIFAILLAVSTATAFAAPAKAYTCQKYINEYGKEWVECW